MTDFTLTNHGTLVLLNPETEIARSWCAEHLPADVLHWGGAAVIEPRYVDPIVDGLINDGLTIEGDARAGLSL